MEAVEPLVMAQQQVQGTAVELQLGEYHTQLLEQGGMAAVLQGMALEVPPGGTAVLGMALQGLGRVLATIPAQVNPVQPCMPNGRHRHLLMPRVDQEEQATHSPLRPQVEVGWLLRPNPVGELEI